MRFNDLHQQYLSIKCDIDAAISDVIAQSSFVGGPHVKIFENLYAQLEEMSTRSIENFTKCLRPCQYKEYRMVNGRVGLSHKFKNISSILMFWFVSTETLVEEQSFVYPWQSLVGVPTISLTLILPTNKVAEFGGTLGLFIGFSFMSLWDISAASFSFMRGSYWCPF